MEVQFTAGNTIDLVEVWRETTVGVPLGRHVVLRRVNYDVGSIGVRELIDLPRDPTSQLYALHLIRVGGGAISIDNVEMIADQSRLMDVTDTVLRTAVRVLGHENASVTDILSLDFVRRDRHSDALPMTMQDLRVRLTFSVAIGQLRVIEERAEVQPARQ